MKTTQFTVEQIIKILDQAEKGEKTVAALCRNTALPRIPSTAGAKPTAAWLSEVQRLKELEKENGRLKRLLAERLLE